MIAAPVQPSAHGLRNLLVALARWVAPADNPSASVYGTLGVGLVIAVKILLH